MSKFVILKAFISTMLFFSLLSAAIIWAGDFYNKPPHKLDAIFYTASYCGACPDSIQKLSEEYHIRIIDVETPHGIKLAKEHKVRYVPYVRYLD